MIWDLSFICISCIIAFSGCNSSCTSRGIEGGSPYTPLSPNLASDISLHNDFWAAQDPDIVWTGSHFTLVWSEVVVDSWGPSRLLFTSISPTGEVTETITLSENSGFRGRTTVVWTGSEVGISWRELNEDLDECMWLMTTSRSGDINQIISTDVRSSKMSLAWSQSLLSVAWADFAGIHYGVWDTGAGSLSEVTTIMNADSITSGPSPSIDWTGTDYITVWQQLDGGPPYSAISLARISEEGELTLTPRQILELENSISPQIACSGTSSGILYIDQDRNLSFVEIDSGGEIISGPDIISSRPVSYNAIIWTGLEYVLLWVEGTLSDGSLAYTTVDHEGIHQIGYIATGGNALLDPSLAWNGTGVGVVWAESRSDPTQCFDRIDDRSGKVKCELDIFYNYLTRE